MSTHDEAVEAAVRAGYERMLSTLPEDALRLPPWEAVPTQIKAQFIETFQFQNAAYLRHMRAAGFVVTQAMEEKPPASAANNEFWRGFYAGWNEYRSRTLANAVEVPE